KSQSPVRKETCTSLITKRLRSLLRPVSRVYGANVFGELEMPSPGRIAHDGKCVRENDLPAPTDDKVGECDRPTI
ncbi:MAG: hypothetical protein VXX79_11110, partial [Pseudomonadota bacterium]|nr:hypothetical protein [Pseudomonadota bacterium]